jgi:hypothetical protein
LDTLDVISTRNILCNPLPFAWAKSSDRVTQCLVLVFAPQSLWTRRFRQPHGDSRHLLLRHLLRHLLRYLLRYLLLLRHLLRYLLLLRHLLRYLLLLLLLEVAVGSIILFGAAYL